MTALAKDGSLNQQGKGQIHCEGGTCACGRGRGERELPEMIEEALLRACGDRLRVRVGRETA